MAYATFAQFCEHVGSAGDDLNQTKVESALERVSGRCDVKLRDRYTLPLAVDVDLGLSEIVCRIARYEIFLADGSNRDAQLEFYRDDAAAAWLLLLDIANQKGSLNVTSSGSGGELDIAPDSGPFGVITDKQRGW